MPASADEGDGRLAAQLQQEELKRFLESSRTWGQPRTDPSDGGDQFRVRLARLATLHPAFRPDHVGGGGDCFYRVLAANYMGNCEAHGPVRQQLANWLRANRYYTPNGAAEPLDLFAYVDQRGMRTWEEWVGLLARAGEWNTAVHLIAGAEVTGRSLHVHTDHQIAAHRLYAVHPHVPTGPAYHLGHLQEVHWVRMVERGEDDPAEDPPPAEDPSADDPSAEDPPVELPAFVRELESYINSLVKGTVGEQVMYWFYRVLSATCGLRYATHTRNTKLLVECADVLRCWFAMTGHQDNVNIMVRGVFSPHGNCLTIITGRLH